MSDQKMTPAQARAVATWIRQTGRVVGGVTIADVDAAADHLEAWADHDEPHRVIEVDPTQCVACTFNDEYDNGPMGCGSYCDLQRRINPGLESSLKFRGDEAPEWCPARGRIIIQAKGGDVEFVVTQPDPPTAEVVVKVVVVLKCGQCGKQIAIDKGSAEAAVCLGCGASDWQAVL